LCSTVSSFFFARKPFISTGPAIFLTFQQLRRQSFSGRGLPDFSFLDNLYSALQRLHDQRTPLIRDSHQVFAQRTAVSCIRVAWRNAITL
jgi:hypothetical protein